MTENEKLSIPVDAEIYKEFLSAIGRVVVASQGLEDNFHVHIVFHYKLKGKEAPEDELNNVLERLRTKSLGKLFEKLQQHVTLPDNFETLLSQAIQKRNFVCHHLVKEREVKLYSNKGIAECSNEIHGIAYVIEEINKVFLNASIKFMEQHGITRERQFAEVRKVQENNLEQAQK